MRSNYSTEQIATIGRNVRQLRKQRHLSQSALGAAAKLSLSFVSKLELGTTEAAEASIGAIAGVLHTTPAALLRDPYQAPPEGAPPDGRGELREPPASPSARSHHDGITEALRLSRDPVIWAAAETIGHGLGMTPEAVLHAVISAKPPRRSGSY